MKRRLLAAIAVILAANASPAQARDLYYGFTLLDPATATATPDSYILVENGRIAEIGRGRPDAPDATPHDMTGLYALPGLIDTHAHVTLGPVSVTAENGAPRIRTTPSDEITAHNARMLLAFGVATIRNPGGPAAESRRYIEGLANGSILGPEMIYAAEVIERSPVPFENLVTQVTPTHSVSQIVAEQARSGARYAKLYIGLSEAEVAEGIVAAHRHGMRAVAHLGDLSWTRAAELGVDALVHMMPVSPDLLPADRRDAYRAHRRRGGFEFFEWYEAADLDAPDVQRMIATLARRRVHLDATLVAFQPAFFGNDPALLDRDRRYGHPAMVANWRAGLRFDLGWQAGDYRRAQAVWPRLLELTRRLYEAGVPLTIGTDLANPFVAPGISVSREMALHQQAGIPAWAVLRMATSDAAQLIGVGERTGALRPGLEADILFIGADPRPDLNRVADVRAVVNNGVLLDPERLRAGN
ncbi:amidohydrolase family protein [Sphingosinicella sp. LHD-64]|uniref:amidohydrolase family protein n=1 Tax=Sphingosinicella sp. LHD-64 TaxID=3072139 RepID=UPI00280CCFDB|nr:amidohydrolase family protein [Sphingosinicella sp. LHD-64]MDQ8757971.1 amidohydrolase family protein [Sphingosinicella sp. LHD-64]